ncbi:unnamed protein product [Oikopleura dioica]|uniref:Uncharacterized protein n=1 Tax=Oikopleura dioica TaxID=34765 RepID=E4YF22_OIKDI|nr:unnamed protein product [Oikopleura dioica]
MTGRIDTTRAKRKEKDWKEQKSKKDEKNKLERKKSSKSRSEASKKSSSGELGYLKSTTARKLKEEEQIVKEDPYADENFATFEPDNSDDGEVYEEDFDEYDDDFEDVEFETKKEQEERLEKRGKLEKYQDWEAIQNAIKRENTQIALKSEKSTDLFQDLRQVQSNTVTDSIPAKKSESLFSINSDKRRNRAEADWKRAKELQKLVTLDLSSEIYFRSFPETDFTRFMRGIGSNRLKCIAIGTDENFASKECQTLSPEPVNVWTQNQESAVTIQSASSENIFTMPKSYINSEKFEKAAQLAEFLLEEIDEEIAHERFSKSPNTGIRLQEPEAIDMDTDWIKTVILTKTEVKLFNLREPSTPIWSMPISARKCRIWRSLVLVGTSFGTIVAIFPDKSVFTTDLVVDGHRASISDLVMEGDELFTADVHGGIRVWRIDEEKKEIKLKKSIDFESDISALAIDSSRVFIATFSKIIIISRTNLKNRIGVIPLTIPADKMLTDMKSGVLVVQTFGEINIYDLKSLREAHTVAQSPRGCATDNGKLIFSTESDLFMLDLSRPQSSSSPLGIKGCSDLRFAQSSKSGLLLLAATAQGVSVYNLSPS